MRGQIITSEHVDEYDAARRVEAGAVDVHPVAIIRAADIADVQAVVNAARETGTPLAVRGRGHSAAGHGTIDDGLVLDMTALTDLQIDPMGRTARAGAGLTAGEYVRAAAAHGLTTPFGDSASVGIVGLTLGGGMGLLSRKLGMTIDWLLGVEIVTADGDLHLVDADHEPELFWALRGGGGNFGVVTALTFRLEEVGDTTGGLLVLPAEAEVLAGFLAAADQAPLELTTIVTIMLCPPMPFVPQELHGQPVLLASLVFAGPAADAERVLAPFRALATPIADLVRPTPYAELLAWEEVPRLSFVARTNFLGKVGEDLAASIISGVRGGPGPMRMVQLRVLGGAISDVANDATAYGFRDRSMVAYVAGVLDGPDGRAATTRWADELAGALDQGDSAVYVNFLGEPGPKSARDGYPEESWPRLRAVKRAYDPGNLFARNHNIPPAD